MKLNSRSKGIINILCDQLDYITYKEIGKLLLISSRTIVREMDSVEKWIKSKGFELVKMPRKGIKILGKKKEKKILRDLLTNEPVDKIYSQKERQDLILLELTQLDEPMKQYYFSSLLEVSEATISHDLDKLEERLAPYNVKIIRKPGLGIVLEGAESDKRQILISIVYDYLDKKQILQLTKQEINKELTKSQTIAQTKQMLLNIVNRDVLTLLEKIINQIREDSRYPLTYSAKIALIVHLALVIQRVRKGDKITINQDLFNELKKSEEFEIATSILNRIRKEFDISIPDSEIGYITMHLKGSRLSEIASGKFDYEFSNFEVVKVANQIIKYVENTLNIDLRKDAQLMNGLVAHLKPALIRLKLNLNIRNPLLTEVMEKYPNYYKLAEESQKAIENFINQKVPKEETGYLAMHIGSAIERLKGSSKRNIRVLVACTTGIGSSRMLSARLKQEFHDIEIVDVLSTVNIEDEELIKKNIDLIISTVEIHFEEFPVVVVSPILSKKDIEKVKNTLNKLRLKLKENDLKYENNLVDYDENLKRNVIEKADNIIKYCNAIKDLMDNIVIIEMDMYNFDSIINKFLEISYPKNIRKQVKKRLIERENIGSTVVRNHRILLLHNKVKEIRHLHVGVIKLKEAMVYKEEKIQQILVLVAPMNATLIEINTISEISKSIILNESFAKSIKEGKQKNIYYEIEKIMDELLKKVMK